jgi:signal transduction histidine kinase
VIRRADGYRGRVAYTPDQPPGGVPDGPHAGMWGRPRPPLTKRLRPGHWFAIDCAAGVVAGLCTALPAMAAIRAPLGPVPVLPALGLATAIGVPVAIRRCSPVPAFCALVLLAVVALPLAGGRVAMSVLLATAYALYMVTVTTSRRTGAAALGLSLTLIVAVALVSFGVHRGGGTGVAIPVAFFTVIAWIIGYSTRQRRLYAVLLQHQAASSAVAEERLRIARELHDVVAHSMSVIAVQAGFGQYVIDTSPAEAREALGAIQSTSRDALEEMRRMLGVLRQQDAAAAPPPPVAPVSPPASPVATPTAVAMVTAVPRPAPLAPEPGLADLGRLIQRTSGTGVRVRLEQSGEVRAVPAGIGLSAYRIIQEALTNVVKHAGSDATCTVVVHHGDEALHIRVTDDGGHALIPNSGAGIAPGAGLTAGAGHGIIGMRERAALCGGSLSAGPASGGGFQVAATLPLRDTPAVTGGWSA